jgi:Flp pilus assembly protein TadD
MDVSLAKWPGDSVLWCAAASAHNSRGDFANATTAAKNSLILNPESEIGHLRLAEITAARDEFTQSVQHTAKLVALNPSSAEYRVMHATSLVSLKRWDEAATMCDEALRIHPLHPQARLLFAVVKHNRGDSVGGRRELDIALKLTASPQLRATMSDWFRRQTR